MLLGANSLALTRLLMANSMFCCMYSWEKTRILSAYRLSDRPSMDLASMWCNRAMFPFVSMPS